MNKSGENLIKFYIELPSDCREIGQNIMNAVFQAGFMMDKSSEGSILFTGYSSSSDYLSKEVWSRLHNLLELNRSDIIKAGGYSLRRQHSKRTDWNEKWKSNFKSKKIGSNWIVIPAWEADKQNLVGSKKTKKGDRFPIILEPGVAFGSGHHPSTILVLTELGRLIKNPIKINSFLDAGCGSAVLSIAAAHLNIPRVKAVDVDELSIKNAERNIKLNRMEDRIELNKNDINRIDTQEEYDLIAANCLPQIHRDIMPRLTNLLTEEGRLLVGGILLQHLRKIGRNIEEHNLTIDWKLVRDGWWLLSCSRS
ncbi:50S ribosomal protein L11 methyltransferase [Halarsenatibacter silvermanii]|uniref:Ribosomal protein L11 methyltransferase n=1 Tax=Halarsenatibacter silvermanii TaxID=321763 RepID=A0A1G9JVQ6_9FIRM|nr:50S ribosomal protein L11 methyltransferase [Halarsenatibacter silvermanii]SDL41720.1 ribosomal protein L11 methyltransferase [Halarsenatibacter silvermanii]